MAAFAVDLGAVRRAHQQLQQAGRSDLRRDATRLVISENQAGRSGYRVASNIQMERLRQLRSPGGAA